MEAFARDYCENVGRSRVVCLAGNVSAKTESSGEAETCSRASIYVPRY